MSNTSIRLLVGLGNPGPEYQETRHNAGFWFTDLIARHHATTLHHENRFHGLLGRATLDDHEIRLLEPLTFVNRSGQSVSAVARYFDLLPPQILVAHDELDLPAGQVRIKQGGGHAGHNGLRDIISSIGSQDFWRLRIGIGRPLERSHVVNYVLHRPDTTQSELISNALERAAAFLPTILTGNIAKVMNQLHTR